MTSTLFSVLLKLLLKVAKRSAQTNRPFISDVPNNCSEARELPLTTSQIFTTKDKGMVTSNRSYTWQSRRAVWNRLVDRFRKNYCPQKSPPLILPMPPTDAEKCSYVNMKRPFLLSCGTFALLAVAFGAWTFAKASPIYSWFCFLCAFERVIPLYRAIHYSFREAI